MADDFAVVEATTALVMVVKEELAEEVLAEELELTTATTEEVELAALLELDEMTAAGAEVVTA